MITRWRLSAALLVAAASLAWAGPLEHLQRIGQVRIAMTVSELKDAIGPPAHIGLPETDATSGWTMVDWNYPGHGLKVRMTTDGSVKGDRGKVWGFTAKAPCHWKTPQGAHIGSSREEVLADYKDKLDADASSDDQVVVGKSDDGLIFRFKEGKVVEINVGPGAP